MEIGARPPDNRRGRCMISIVKLGVNLPLRIHLPYMSLSYDEATYALQYPGCRALNPGSPTSRYPRAFIHHQHM
jgi:hypothetical protein